MNDESNTAPTVSAPTGKAPADPDKVSISFQLTPELRDRLDRVCVERMIGRAFLIGRFIADGMDRLDDPGSI